MWFLFFRYLEENKLSGSYVRVPEENWDGCSMTFQGNNTHSMNYHQPATYQQPSTYTTLPPSYSNQHGSHPHNYYSLPRGRGRLHQEFEPVIGGMTRSITPDRVFRSPCNSRPPTPPPFTNSSKYGENVSQYSRPETPVQVQRPDENYNARRGLDKPIYEENNFVEERFNIATNTMSNVQSEEQSNSFYKSSEETLTRVARALAEDTRNKMYVKSLEEQLSPVSPPTPTPEPNSKSNMVLVSVIL